MNDRERLWQVVARWVLTVSVALCMVVLSFRAVTDRRLVAWEYQRAGFPPDPLGLPIGERSRLAETCVDYLSTNASITVLSSLKLPDGNAAFDSRELRHMVDVQNVYRLLMSLGFAAAIVTAGCLAVLTRAAPGPGRIAGALSAASALVLVLLLAVGAFMLANWSRFFTAFHHVFFEGDTWLFSPSDTLIRLFPMRFWMDTAAAVVGLIVLQALAVGIASRLWEKRDAVGARSHEEQPDQTTEDSSVAS
jgi:integral membrane protein (TIGR01906 family)